ncbi:hypothetical protein [Kordiimonas sp.]|uniref:hypothetical protein n=1 Tax=Kordiimonas sp. TaxID=1970157 RepID=UPI003A945D73
MAGSAQKIDGVPTWVKDGSWQPWYLKLVKGIRRHMFLLLILVALLSQEADVYALLSLPLAVLFDYILGKTSWISNTRSTAIYLAVTTDNRAHVGENFLEVCRRDRPFLTYAITFLVSVAPTVIYLILELELPNIFKFYYMFFLMLMSCSFAFTAYSARGMRARSKVGPLEFAYKFGLLDVNLPSAIAVKSLVFVFPGLLAFWGLTYGASGFSIIHLGALYFCATCIHYIYRAEYNLSLYFVAKNCRVNWGGAE